MPDDNSNHIDFLEKRTGDFGYVLSSGGVLPYRVKMEGQVLCQYQLEISSRPGGTPELQPNLILPKD
jgi:hypothetical protein